MPYEHHLIPQLEEIKLEFKEAIEDHIGHFNFDDLIFISGNRNSKNQRISEQVYPPSQNPEQIISDKPDSLDLKDKELEDAKV